MNDTPEFTGYMIDEASYIKGKEYDFSSVHRSKVYVETMNQYFNTKDDMTRKVLLAVNESDQNLIMTSLANKLYSYIVTKVDNIDFGTIPLSKGDVTKIEKYDQLVSCIDILSKILQNYNQPLDNIQIVSLALQNVQDRRELFLKAYKINAEFPIVTYNTIVLSIVSAVSLLISAHIEFIKIVDDKGYDIAFDRASKIKSKDKLLFNNLQNFNDMCSSGQFDKVINYAMSVSMGKQHEQYMTEGIADTIKTVAAGMASTTAFGALAGKIGSSLGGASGTLAGAVGGFLKFLASSPWITIPVAIVAGLYFLIKVIRALIFYFYYCRVKMTDFLDMQSSVVYMNAMNIKNSLSKNDRERKEIAAKQAGIAAFCKKLADYIRVKDASGEAKATAENKKVDNERYNYREVIDRIPDSAQAALF